MKKFVSFLATVVTMVACAGAAILLPEECQMVRFIFAILAVVYWFLAADKGFELFSKSEEFRFFRVEEADWDSDAFDN